MQSVTGLRRVLRIAIAARCSRMLPQSLFGVSNNGARLERGSVKLDMCLCVSADSGTAGGLDHTSHSGTVVRLFLFADVLCCGS